ncbi:MAG: hypothetical protein ACQGVK_18520 [Myxococcota bacterium]
MWAALALALSPVVFELASELPETRFGWSLLLAPLLLWRAERTAGGPSAPAPAALGWGFIVVALALELLGLAGDLLFAAGLAIPVAVLGMALATGRPSPQHAVLLFWLVPIPTAAHLLGTPRLESAVALLGAWPWQVVGVPLEVAGPLIRLGGGLLEVTPYHDGLHLAVLLAGIGWYAGVRRCEGLLGAARCAAAGALLALPGQALAAVVAAGLLAAGLGGGAEWVLEYGVGLAAAVVGLSWVELRAASDGLRDRTPIFQAPAPARPPTRRLLLVSVHFPPGQAAGALRWQKFSRIAAERGWGLDVVTLSPSSLGSSDPSRLADLPDGTRVFGIADRPLVAERLEGLAWRLLRRLRARRPAAAAGGDEAPGAAPRSGSGSGASRPLSLGREDVLHARLSARGLFRAYGAWVDYARSGRWSRRAAALGRSLARRTPISAIASSGPPQMAHDAARRLARVTKRPLVLDFRDPWADAERLPEHLASPLWLHLAERFEAAAVSQAAIVAMNTDPARDAMAARHPAAAGRILTVLNGYDEDALPPASRGPRFLLAYAGAIYIDRTPDAVFAGAARAVESLSLTPDEFGIEFMGPVDLLGERPIEGLAERAGIGAFVRVHPPGTRDQAARFLAGAHMLLNLPQDSHKAIPSKIYEYMRFDAWLLVLAERGSATERLLRGTGADVVEPTDVDAIASCLVRRIEAHRRGEKAEPLASDAGLGRRAQATRLFEALEAVAS